MLWFVEHFFCGSRCCDIKVCGFYGGSTGLQRGDSWFKTSVWSWSIGRKFVVLMNGKRFG